MTTATVGSETFALLDIPPDWRGSVEVRVTMPSTVDETLTRQEVRRASALFPRFGIKYGVTVEGAAAWRLESNLRALVNRPVVCPMWTLGVGWASRGARPFSSRLSVVYSESMERCELFTTTAPGWVNDSCVVFPALVGRLKSRAVRWISGRACEMDVDFEEQSPVEDALTVEAEEFEAGPLPSDKWDVPPSIVPFDADFDAPSESFSVETNEEEIGFGRLKSETVYQDASVREFEGNFYANGRFVEALQFWRQHAHGKAVWALNSHPCATLAADVPAFSRIVPVVDGSSVSVGDFVAFTWDDGVVFGVVETVTPTAIWLEAPVGFVPQSATVSRATLCRFSSSSVSFEFQSVEFCRFTALMREVDEANPGEWDTLGDTVGELPARIFLYEFSQTLPSGTVVVERFTSFEDDVEDDEGRIWTAARCSHGSISSSDKLDRGDADVTASIEDSAIVRSGAAMTARSPIFCRIFEASASRVRAFDSSHSADEYQ